MTRPRLILVFGLALLYLGGASGGSCGTETTSDDGSGTLSLTSSESADGFEDGGTIPTSFACKDITGGGNQLPTVSWSGASEDTESFALTVIDISTDPDTVHMIMIDIPTTKTEEDDEDDCSSSNCAKNYLGNHGYDGPCPPEGDTHTYEFKLYALDVNNLAQDAGADLTDSDDVLEKIRAHDLDSDKISGKFTAP